MTALSTDEMVEMVAQLDRCRAHYCAADVWCELPATDHEWHRIYLPDRGVFRWMTHPHPGTHRRNCRLWKEREGT